MLLCRLYYRLIIPFHHHPPNYSHRPHRYHYRRPCLLYGHSNLYSAYRQHSLGYVLLHPWDSQPKQHFYVSFLLSG